MADGGDTHFLAFFCRESVTYAPPSLRGSGRAASAQPRGGGRVPRIRCGKRLFTLCLFPHLLLVLSEPAKKYYVATYSGWSSEQTVMNAVRQLAAELEAGA